MDKVRLELDELGRMLQRELSHERKPVKEDCAVCSRLRHELDIAHKSSKTHLERIHELEKQVQVNRKLMEENESLKKQPVRDIEQPSYESIAGELAIEKQRRLRAEQELAMHRKQGKTNDEKLAANAKRVAMALAQHCLELSQELEKLRQTSGRCEPSASRHSDKLKQAYAPEVITQPAGSGQNGNGWGMDDDIFDDPN